MLKVISSLSSIFIVKKGKIMNLRWSSFLLVCVILNCLSNLLLLSIKNVHFALQLSQLPNYQINKKWNVVTKLLTKQQIWGILTTIHPTLRNKNLLLRGIYSSFNILALTCLSKNSLIFQSLFKLTTRKDLLFLENL